MRVNAREIRYENQRKKMLLSIFDVTEQRNLEQEKEKLMTQKDLLLKEMRHRIANSLQLIASILLLKAESVDSQESRAHLEDAHERILSIATVQQQLDPAPSGDEIAVADYLSSLCKSLSRSMIGGRKPISIIVEAGTGEVSSDVAVSFGLITTELVINAIKHAFVLGQKGSITVYYTANSSGWTLSVADDGVGQVSAKKGAHVGLGTSIIGALANQLHAVIRTTSTPHGTKVSISHENL
jgi:chemotaxis protein methyltransferase CheR